ncbi:dihydroxyacetone kinase subunit DhaL, partial [Streptococcus sobrinus]
GMAAIMEALDQSEPATTADLFKLVSMQLLSKVGGASGPLYGSAFIGMTKAEQAGVDLPGLIEAGLEMIQKRGKATTNEKTMVDVWAGVLDALKENKLNAAIIDQLVQASKDMKATKGRASYVGERSIGHVDPGSSSSGLLFKALLEVGGT